MPYDNNNIFAKIIRGEIPCNEVYSDDEVLAFHDASPAAPVHVLVVPKGEYTSFDDFAAKADTKKIGSFFEKVREIASKLDCADGYRLITNNGKNASQTVEHFHVHILGGKPLGGLVASDKLER